MHTSLLHSTKESDDEQPFYILHFSFSIVSSKFHPKLHLPRNRLVSSSITRKFHRRHAMPCHAMQQSADSPCEPERASKQWRLTTPHLFRTQTPSRLSRPPSPPPTLFVTLFRSFIYSRHILGETSQPTRFNLHPRSKTLLILFHLLFGLVYNPHARFHAHSIPFSSARSTSLVSPRVPSHSSIPPTRSPTCRELDFSQVLHHALSMPNFAM